MKRWETVENDLPPNTEMHNRSIKRKIIMITVIASSFSLSKLITNLSEYDFVVIRAVAIDRKMPQFGTSYRVF